MHLTDNVVYACLLAVIVIYGIKEGLIPRLRLKSAAASIEIDFDDCIKDASNADPEQSPTDSLIESDSCEP